MRYRAAAVDAFSTQRQVLWELCYRMTGMVGDADMLLRECVLRPVERPLAERNGDWPSHLMRFAATLSMEALRHRRRRHYVGCWLPSPVDTGSAVSMSPRPDAATGSRYDMLESSSMAFLTGLEALEPRERAVLLMCDVFAIRTQEAALTLRVTSATARTLLRHARQGMQHYDATRQPPTASSQLQAAALLRDALLHLQHHDAAGLEKILARDVRAIFDSAGEFVAPVRSITGCGMVAKLLTKFAVGSGPVKFAFRMLNGLPAALCQCQDRPRWAKRFVLRVETRQRVISEVHVIMAAAKLTAVRFDPI